ncbi:MAG: PKD domain-containing protein [Thermoplasmata archaeon]|nr:MAG: PKD domain-containing protein [Thermoplasmata archaeon]
MRMTVKVAATAIVLMLIAVAFQPVVAENFNGMKDYDDESRGPDEIPGPFRNLKELVLDLIDQTPQPEKSTDTDGDGLPDNVEWVIGTNFLQSDSDFDRLSDYIEVMNNMDPTEPDSNMDGLPDTYEFDEYNPDPDGDGVPNVWDRDNDGDSVYDAVDMSPFMRTDMRSSFEFDILTEGGAVYIELQLRTKNPDNMRLINQNYDWPYDKEGTMMDVDNSINDVVITPLLEFTSNNTPEGAELEDYGIMTSGNVSYIPVFPVWDYGNIVAFKAKMFYPATGSPAPIKGDLRLSWKVKGLTDVKSKGLAANIGGAKYVTPGTDDVAYATSEWMGEQETFYWIETNETRGGFQTRDGRYLVLNDEDVMVLSEKPLSDYGYFDVEDFGSKKVLKAHNGKYLRVQGDRTIIADSDTPDVSAVLELVDRGYLSRSTTLAMYYEDFLITGANVEENYGTDAGVLYSDNVTHYFGANLRLAYDFLRNGTNDIHDVPDILDEHNIVMNYNITTFDHKDLAVQALLVDLVKEAMTGIPEGDMRPVIMLMETRTSTFMLAEVDNTTHILRDAISMDLGQMPVVVTKTLKSPWYEEGSEEPVDMKQVIDEIDTWSIEMENKATVARMMMAWSVGENFVAKVGPDLPTYHFPEDDEIPLVVDGIIDKGFAAISALATIIKVVKTAYEWTKVHKISKLFTEPLTSVKSISKTFSTVSKINSGTMKIVNKIGTALEIIGLVIDIGIAIYCMFAIADAYDWSAIGIGIGVLYGVMMIAYAVVLFAIGMIPYVGWLIALLITLSDLIVGWITGKGWSQRLMEWIVDLVTDFRARSEVDMQMLDTEVIIHDYDDNGVDVGDRLEYKSLVTTRVNRTVDGTWSDVTQSYIKPQYNLSIPAGSYSDWDRYRNKVTHRDDPSGAAMWRETDYSIGAWVEPSIGMVNYPVTLTFNAETKTYYEECWWAVVWWCDRKSTTRTIANDPVTLYFDVMPGSVDEFRLWRGIKSNDWDGDGLNNTDEERTSQWKWDTDGDGLGDDYELTIGSLPWKYDSDGDGLSDMAEHLWNSNPRKKDTDGDGLNDYIEHNGWVVSFNYFNEDFHWHINSNPRFNDTDGDGVNDFLEYRTLQNPRSADTDGDGLIDVIKDYYETYFHHKKNMAEGPAPKAVAVDGAGNVYIAVNRDGLSLTANCIAKYDKDGVFKKMWNSWQDAGTPRSFSSIADVHLYNGHLYVLDVYRGITKWNLDGAYRNWKVDEFTNPGLRYPFALDIDDDGNVYVAEANSHTVRIFDQNRRLVGTIGSYGNGDGQLNQPRSVAWHPEGWVYVGDNRNRVQKFAVNGTHLATYTDTVVGRLIYPHDLDVDRNGDVFVIEYGANRIQKVDKNFTWIDTMCAKGTGNGEVTTPLNLVITEDNFIYIADYLNYRVQKMWQQVEFVPASSYFVFTDTDGDGFNDADEANEWTVTVVNASGTIKFNVTSDEFSPDSDGDGLNDLKEFQLLSNPLSPDTDGDGISDAEELAAGTNVTNWDTDGDGLDDGIELTFGSNALAKDSDQDGLFDNYEWKLGADPMSKDTDEDGLDDLQEVLMGSDITNADSDGDFLFDGAEITENTNPMDPDLDGDGITDGYETVFKTDPTNGDTDGDNLLDGFEIGMRINPLSNDSDGDTVLDGTELDVGLNPNSPDSDGDGVPDSLDLDYEVELDQSVYLAIDNVGNRTRFIDNMMNMLDVKVVEPREVISSHKNARFIVLVGDPTAEDGTAGSIIRSLLEDTPDLLERISTSDEFHITVRYGKWAPSQTIVMLSKPYPSDHIRVAGILRSMRMTVDDGAVAAQYLNPRSCFMMDDVDTVMQTDCEVWTKLDEMATFSVGITKYDDTTTPHKLEAGDGLEAGDEPLGKYVSVEVSESIQTNLTDMVTSSNIKLYYTVEELDMTGDGDADDPEDINEETLSLYRYDEEEMEWVKVREDLSWVTATGVNTTDVELYGTQYAGYVWAEISHFSHFGAGGRPNTFLPTLANAGEDIDGLTHQIIEFNGSESEGNGQLNYTWTFYHRSQLVTLYGPTPTFVFTETGDYVVTLIIKDEYHVVDGDTVFVTIVSLAEEMFDLMVGPILDEHGEPVEDAPVRVSVSGFRFFGITDDEGIAEVEMAEAFQGRTVDILVVGSGYEALEFEPTITMEGTLDPPPPTMYRELTDIVAHAGLDRTVRSGEEVAFDGTLSWGNGGIVNYTWTLTHKGSTRTLYGPTPIFTFEVEGSYPVTLTVTDFRELTDETVVTITVIPAVVDEFTLFVGPIMDQHNLPVVGARVDVYIDDDEYYEATLADGVAYFVLPGSAMGQDVTVRVRADTIEPIEYDTFITAEGDLDQNVPEAKSTTKHEAPGAGEGGGFPAWLIGAIVAVVVVLLLVFLLITGRIGGRRRDSFEEMETEAEEEDTEVTVEDDLEDVLSDLEEAEASDETPTEEDEVHVVEPPVAEPTPEEGTEERSFKDLPRSDPRKQKDATVERQVEEKDLSSVDADSEVEDGGESEDTEL